MTHGVLVTFTNNDHFNLYLTCHLVHFLKFFRLNSQPCKDYNENKHKYKATAQTIETEHAKKAHQISSQRLYKKEGEGACLTYF